MGACNVQPMTPSYIRTRKINNYVTERTRCNSRCNNDLHTASKRTKDRAKWQLVEYAVNTTSTCIEPTQGADDDDGDNHDDGETC